MWSVLWTKNHLDWIDLRKAGHKAPTYRQMSNYCMQQDGVLLPRKDQLSSYSLLEQGYNIAECCHRKTLLAIGCCECTQLILLLYNLIDDGECKIQNSKRWAMDIAIV
jgi:hypothetical protein